MIDAAAVRAWLQAFAGDVAENRDLLTQLDAAIGDADHGANLDRGLTAVVSALDDAEAAARRGAVLKTTGMTLVSTVGGASGPLYGTLFLRMAGSAGDAASLDAAGFAAALRAGLEGVVARGKAQAGRQDHVRRARARLRRAGRRARRRGRSRRGAGAGVAPRPTGS